MKTTINYLLLLLILLHLVLGIWWLAITWLVVYGIFWLSTSKQSIAVKFRKMTLLVYPLILVGAVGLAIFLRVVVFGVFVIPSGSMEQTILPGDVVWVNKLMYGPRLPRTPYEIPWINIFFWLAEKKQPDLEKKWWDHLRLKGYSRPRHNDVVVFNHPYGGDVYIKRCVALPSDTITIKDGKVYINGHCAMEPFSIMFRMRAVINDPEGFIRERDNIVGFQTHHYPVREEGYLRGHFTRTEAEALLQLSSVETVETDPDWPVNLRDIHPRHEGFDWTLDDFGPFVLPAKGSVISTDERNFRLYRRIINVFEGVRIRYEDGSCYINDEPADSYTFKNDYYFMMGDNRHDSNDSRYFGPVPESQIEGRASFVLFNKNQNQPGVIRLFKGLN